VNYTEVASKYLNMVYRLALVCVKDKLNAENITKKVFTKYSYNYHKMKSEEQARTWFIRAVIWRGMAIKYSDWYRAGHPRGESTEVMMYAYESDNDKELVEYLNIRPFSERIAAHLVYHENMTVEQVSSILFVKKTKIEHWIKRAAEIQAGKWANVPDEQTPTYKERYTKFMEQFLIRNSVIVEISHIFIDLKFRSVNTPLKGYRVRPTYIIFLVAVLLISLIFAIIIQIRIRENPIEVRHMFETSKYNTNTKVLEVRVPCGAFAFGESLW